MKTHTIKLNQAQIELLDTLLGIESYYIGTEEQAYNIGAHDFEQLEKLIGSKTLAFAKAKSKLAKVIGSSKAQEELLKKTDE